MKRATVTIPDDLESEVEAYIWDLEVPPALTAVMETALREYSLRGDSLQKASRKLLSCHLRVASLAACLWTSRLLS
jgi:hypothetical protein